MTRLGAVVLAGGASTRMGSAKAWLDFHGEPLLARVVRRVASFAGVVVVVGAPEQDLPELPRDVLLVRDRERGMGPLEGLAVGLECVEKHASYAFVCTCDAPFVSEALALRLLALCEDDAAVPLALGRLHPLSAVYACHVHATARRLRERGERRVRTFVEALHSRLVDAEALLAAPALAKDDPNLWGLLNLNYPEELERARSLVLPDSSCGDRT